jgi:hypothetical protein
MKKIVKRLAFALTVAFASGSGRVRSMVGRHGQLSLVGAAAVTSALLLVSVSSAGSSADSGIDPASQQVAAVAGKPSEVVARHAQATRRSSATPAGQAAAHREVLRRHLSRPSPDYDQLRRELAGIGAADLQIDGAPHLDTQQTSAKAESAPGPRALAAAESGSSKCAAPPPRRFKCELLFFHENSPGGSSRSDVAVLTWQFEEQPTDRFSAREGAKGWHAMPDDVAAINFGKYNEKCYDPSRA